MGSKFYAVGNANGPITVAINMQTAKKAREWFADRDWTEFVDHARTDAEDDFGADGDGMSHSEWADVMRSNGYEIADPDLTGGNNWVLWGVAVGASKD